MARTVRGVIRKKPTDAGKAPAATTIVDIPPVSKVAVEPNNVPEADWSWIPPKQSPVNVKTLDKHKIPILKGVNLTMDEVTNFLESNGAENVQVIKLSEPLDSLTHFIIASASSPRLIRKLLAAVVDVIKQRELLHYIAAGGIEGDRTDDWQLIDCYSFLVHVMLPDTRKHLDLESHWTQSTRPCLPYTDNEKDYDEAMNRLLDAYPLPLEYQKRVFGDDDADAPSTVKVL